MNKRNQFLTGKTKRVKSEPKLEIEPPTVQGTEDEWLAATHFHSLAWAIGYSRSDRKTRLWLVACCDRFSEHFEPGVLQSIVAAGYALADDQLPELERQSLLDVTSKIVSKYKVGNIVRPTARAYASVASTMAIYVPLVFIVDLHYLSIAACLGASRNLPSKENVIGMAAKKAEDQWQAMALRDILGNPFRPVAFEPAWRTEAVVGIAQGIYDDRAFERMPILADALEEAGCEQPDILTHCREPGEHVRGCWVVDLVLGKA